MAKNVGTLVSAAIRPNDSLDPIATAWSSEVRGGLHTVINSTDRDNIIFERREWGMMCYVRNENKTYQLTYGYASGSNGLNIMSNLNWKEFSGSGGSGGGSEWVDSVISILLTEPSTPSHGDRYLLGTNSSVLISGLNWTAFTASQISEWDSVISEWNLTTPKDGMSVRVDNDDNSIYKYEGNFPSGNWYREVNGQVRNISASTSDGENYLAFTNPPINTVSQDLVFLTKFSAQNIGATVSLNINSLGQIPVKKPSSTGLVNLNPQEIQPGLVYSLVFDGVNFQLNRPYVNEDVFNVKYYVEPTDYIVIPQYYQYWVYGDLTLEGTLENYGHVIIANGSLIMSGSGSYLAQPGSQILLLSVTTTTTFNDTDTIEFDYQISPSGGASVSAIVRDSSLTASKLDTGTNGGATAGYLLSVDENGKFKWIGSVTSSVLSKSDKNYIMTFDTVGDNSATGLVISQTPLPNSYVGVFVNGQEFEVGNLTSGVYCYFSDDGGLTAKTDIEIGDELYWNGNFVGTDLYTNWRISLYYLT
jgi:hypothetical protein